MSSTELIIASNLAVQLLLLVYTSTNDVKPRRNCLVLLCSQAVGFYHPTIVVCEVLILL